MDSKRSPKRGDVTKAKKAVEDDLEEDEYVVEAIVGRRKGRGGVTWQYEVKWQGYDETTWEPEINLKSCKLLLNEFIKSEDAKKAKELAKAGASPSPKRRKAATELPPPAVEAKDSRAPRSPRNKRTKHTESVEEIDENARTAELLASVNRVAGLTQLEKGDLLVYVEMGPNNITEYVTAKDFRQGAPRHTQLLLDYYESRLKFDTKKT